MECQWVALAVLDNYGSRHCRFVAVVQCLMGCSQGSNDQPTGNKEGQPVILILNSNCPKIGQESYSHTQLK